MFCCLVVLLFLLFCCFVFFAVLLCGCVVVWLFDSSVLVLRFCGVWFFNPLALLCFGSCLVDWLFGCLGCWIGLFFVVVVVVAANFLLLVKNSCLYFCGSKK